MADIVTLDQLLEHLNLSTPTDTLELELFISAATAHVETRYGTFPSAVYTNALTVFDDDSGVYEKWLRPNRYPVTAVTSATSEDGLTVYTTGFTISADGFRVRHAQVLTGEWTLIYTAGKVAPADLRLCVLEDIRGLYQPGQIGPPAVFGAFGLESTEVGTSYRPVRMWPRVDAWLESNVVPGFA